MNSKILTSVLLFVGLVLFGCSSGGTDVSNPPVPTTTKLISSTLGGATTRGIRLKKSISTNCGGDLATCLTPDKVAGEVYYAGIMIGLEDGYSLGPIVGDVTDPSVITAFLPDDLQDFNLGEQLEVDGGIVCCGGSPYPADSEAIAQSVDIYFAYTDVTFTLEEGNGISSALTGTHTIRTVFGDIDGTSFKKGDLLYKGTDSEAFVWCTEADGCVFTDRPASPVQNPDIADYAGSENGLGNQTIPTFTANLEEGHEEIQITESQVLSNSFAFTIDFDMTNGVGFTEDVRTFTEIDKMVSSYRLAAKPGSQEEGFTSTVTVEMTPLPE